MLGIETRAPVRLTLGVVVAFAALTLGSAQTTRTTDEQNTIEVFSKAKLGVVHIRVRQQRTGEFGSTGSSEAMGSGFAIDGDGHVLTNYHVISSSNRIEVFLPGGRMEVAQVIGTAPTLDLALLRVHVEPEDPVEALPLGDSDALEVGQKVIAVGHPLSLHNSLTVGVVSARDRSLPESPMGLRDSLIQTDAAISRGSSGGPLLDSTGKVIAIATALAREGQNLGFAVPTNLAKRVVPDLIKMGHVYQPSLGIDGTEITPEIAKLFGLSRNSGLLVGRVTPRSLAERAGIRAGKRVVLLNESVFVLGGDIVTAIEGKKIVKASDMMRALLSAHPGQILTLTIQRGEALTEVKIQLMPMH